MRLVCPNCEAKYEVPDDAIPDPGRDVQCANCGHAWFQTRTRAVTASTPLPAGTETATAGAVGVDPVPQPAAEPKAADVAPEPRKSPKAEPGVPEPAETASAKPDEADLPVEPPAKAIDEKVLSILREEAEREAAARREPSRPLESQPDLGIEAAAGSRKKAAAKKREPEPDAAKPAARRDLLPDVEEINSTLRPSEEPEPEFAGGPPEAEQREGRGAFRAGFLLVISFAILGASIYITSDWLSAMVPQLAGPLDAFVGLVDGLRQNLDALMRSATHLITGEAN